MEQKELNVKASQVKANDQLLAIYDLDDVKSGKNVAKRVGEANNVAVLVETVQTGTSVTTLNTPHGALRLDMAAEVLVARMVKDEDDIRAENTEYASQLLDKFVEAMVRLRDTDVMAWLNDKLDGYKNEVGRGLAWYGQDAMELAAKVKYAAQFCDMLNRNNAALAARANDGTEPEGWVVETRGELFVAWYDECQKELMRMARDTSSSTSQMSNLNDTMQRVALAKLLEGEFGYGTTYLYHLLTTEKLVVS